MGTGRVDRVKATLAVRPQQKRLEFDAHHRAASVGFVLRDGALQDSPGRTLKRLAVRFQIGDHHAGSIGPAFADRLRVEDGAHVGETLEEAGTRVGVHLPVEAEGEGGEAVPGGRGAGEEDLAAGEPEVVGPEGADATEGGGGARRGLYHLRACSALPGALYCRAAGLGRSTSAVIVPLARNMYTG